MIFRRASRTDQAVLCEAFEEENRCPDDCHKYFIGQDLRQCEFVLVMNDENQLMGHALILWQSRLKQHRWSQTPEIMDVYVYSKFRRLGVARTLVLHLEEMIKKKGFEKSGLGVNAGEARVHIHNLYRGMGYYPIGTDQLAEGDVMVYEKILAMIFEK